MRPLLLPTNDPSSSDPEFARGYVELGLSYYELEKYAEAEQAFKKGCEH